MATSTSSTTSVLKRAPLPKTAILFHPCFGETSVSCCGMITISGCSVTKTEYRYKSETSPYYEPKHVSFTLREAYEAIDKSLPAIVSRRYGQFILTDRISGYEMDVWHLDQTDLDTKIDKFSVKDFVKYLIARKIGTIVRGPISHNPVYGATHAICAWIWIANDAYLLDPLSETLSEGIVSDENREIGEKMQVPKILACERAMMDVQWPPVQDKQSTTSSSKA